MLRQKLTEEFVQEGKQVRTELPTPDDNSLAGSDGALPTDGSPADPPGRSLVAGLCGVLVLGTFAMHAATFWHQVNDDAFITFRYARNLAAGLGPYYNPGEHVEGFTNPLLMLQLSAAIALLGPDAVVTVARIIGVLSGGVAILAAWWLARAALRSAPTLRTTAASLAWLAGGLVATNAAFALNSTSGLETIQFSAILTLAVVVLAAEAGGGRFLGCALLLGLAVWSRPEGGLVAAGVLAAQGLLAGRAWRAVLRDAAIVALFAATLLGLRLVLFDGEWLPNTYFAKRGGFAGVSAGAYLGEYTWFHLGGPLALLAVIPLLPGVSPPAVRRLLAPAAIVVAAGVAICLLVGADWMLGFRFLVPYAPLWSALAITGLGLLAARLAVRPALVAVVGLALISGIWLGQQQVRADRYVPWVSTRAVGYRNGHHALATWLAAEVRPGETVALMDIGIVGYHCPLLRIRDISGLTDRTIAKAPGGFLDKRFPPEEVLDQRPAFLVLTLTAPRLPGPDGPRFDPAALTCWTGIEERLAAAPAFRAHYVRLRPPQGNDWLADLAARAGAARIFEHDYPDRYYFLAAYRLQP